MNKNNIIDDFWNSAYSNLEDGGYISNNVKINDYRFYIEDRELREFIQKYTTKGARKRALDVGCGNGRFSRILAQYFDKVDAIDIAQSIIEKNHHNNSNFKIDYYKSTLEEWVAQTKSSYDFIYVGGVLMYIENIDFALSNKYFSNILNRDATLLLRESVMTKESVDNISENYIAYYRAKDFYTNIEGLKLIDVKENLAYRVGELKSVLSRLKLGFLFQRNIYRWLLKCLMCKDLVWKPNLNKLVNYYYIFKKEQ